MSIRVGACAGSVETGRIILLAKLICYCNKYKLIYRFSANPRMPRGGVLPPTPVLAPGSALGSRPRVALSSAQAPPIYSGVPPPGNSRQGHSRLCFNSVIRGAGPGAPGSASQVPHPLPSAWFPPGEYLPDPMVLPPPSTSLRWPGYARHRSLLTTLVPATALAG